MIQGQQEVLTYNIMLKENTLTNLRTYTQFIDVLGDVGGLMEVIEKIIGVICALVADILYDKTMVNNLFSFDLNNYTINIKKKHAYNIKDINGINTSYLNNEKNDIKYNKKEINVSKIPQENQLIIGNKNLILKNLLFQKIIALFIIMGIVRE